MRSTLGHSHMLAKDDSKKPTSDSALRHDYKFQCETNTTQNQKCSYIDIRPHLPHFTVFVRQCMAILMASIHLFTQTDRNAGCSDNFCWGQTVAAAGLSLFRSSLCSSWRSCLAPASTERFSARRRAR